MDEQQRSLRVTRSSARRRRPPTQADEEDPLPTREQPSTGESQVQRRVRRGLACSQCRQLKRCWRLALPCRPQQLGDGEEDGAKEGTVGSRSGGESGDGPPAPKLMDLAFSRGAPVGCAELMAQAFMELHAQGRVVRDSAIRLARTLSILEQLVGSDPSWGLCKLIKETQDVSIVDLESTEGLLLSPPQATREAELQAYVGRMVAAKERAREEPCFKDLCAANPSAAVYMGVVIEGHTVVEVSNAVFDAWWQASSYFYDELVRRKTMTTLLFASLVDPEDRKALLDATVTHFVTGISPPPIIIKAFNNEGEMGLYHTRIIGARPLANGMPTVSVAVLERLPASRHLSLTPGRRDVMQSFKSMEGAAGAGAGVGVATTGGSSGNQRSGGSGQEAVVLLPGLACIPTTGPIDAACMEAATSFAAAAAVSPPSPPPHPALAVAVPAQEETAAWAGVGVMKGSPVSLAESDFELLQQVFQDD